MDLVSLPRFAQTLRAMMRSRGMTWLLRVFLNLVRSLQRRGRAILVFLYLKLRATSSTPGVSSPLSPQCGDELPHKAPGHQDSESPREPTQHHDHNHRGDGSPADPSVPHPLGDDPTSLSIETSLTPQRQYSKSTHEPAQLPSDYHHRDPCGYCKPTVPRPLKDNSAPTPIETSPSLPAPAPSRPPKSKALLVGICYTRNSKRRAKKGLNSAKPSDGGKHQQQDIVVSCNGDVPVEDAALNGPNEPFHLVSRGGKATQPLRGPHRDCRELKKLLIEQYGYQPEDIVCLMDDGQHPRPTRQNIIKECHRLVQDAQPGDRLVFHYAGHARQMENKNNTEEDGLDEVLVTLGDSGCNDHGGSFIRDNDLKQYLVCPLVAGVKFVAVLDTCHSATLLDLPHHLCNQVYVPYISKGPRSCRTLQQGQVRRNAAHMVPARINRYFDDLAIHQIRSDTLVRTLASAFERKKRTHSRPNSLAISFHLDGGEPERPRRVSARRSQSWAENSVLSVLQEEPISGSASEQNGAPSIETSVLPALATEKLSKYCDEQCASPDVMSRRNSLNAMFPDKLCMSPKRVFPCDGFCKQRSMEKGIGPHVMSIAACDDPELTWESPSGNSLTMSLVKVLRESPHSSLAEVMKRVSHHMHQTTMMVHAEASKRRANGQPVTLETHNFSTPKLASLEPMDMDIPFTL